MRLYGLLGGGKGKYVSMCKACGKLGSPECQEILILNLLLGAIGRNLGLFYHKHNLPFIVLLYLIYM